EAAAYRRPEVTRALRRSQPLAMDDEFVAFGLAAEHRMVLENQASEFEITVVEAQRRCHPADSTTCHDAVEDLVGFDRLMIAAAKHIITDLVAGMDDLISVPITSRIIACA